MQPQQETLADRLKKSAMEKAMSKGEEALLEKAGAKTVAAAGAAMGDPTGGIATEVAYEAAMPMLRSLLGGLFNKGGYVNGPLSVAHLMADPLYKSNGGPLTNKGV
jgi:hypothetical protein